MSETLYVNNPGLRAAEEQTVDACLAIADEGGLQARVQRMPADDPNSVKFSVLLYPPLFETYERVAWRRTFAWGARHWGLPPGLIGTRFTYRREEYEFVGATLRSTLPDGFFVAVRQSDGWIMHLGEGFVRQVILPAMPESPELIGIFSVGLGEKEKFFL